MRFVDALRAAGRRHDSMLCVGLDPDPAKLPAPWRDDPRRLFDFCAAIVDATHDLVIAFKPQIAYFAAQRAEDQLERLIDHIHRTAPGVPVILDAKRGDIGATAVQYAREAFERYRADAVTLSPYMGFDSIEPYLGWTDKGAFLLCRTSNPGGADLQTRRLEGSGLLFEEVARLAAGPWNRRGQLGLVVGATYPDELARVRALAPTLPLLVPGIGAQGGDAEAVVRAARPLGTVSEAAAGTLIVSSSRAVLYAAADAGFAVAARAAADATRLALNRARTGDRAHAGDPPTC